MFVFFNVLMAFRKESSMLGSVRLFKEANNIFETLCDDIDSLF